MLGMTKKEEVGNIDCAIEQGIVDNKKEEPRNIDHEIEQKVLKDWKKETLGEVALIENPHKQLSILKNNVTAVNAAITEREVKNSKTAKRKGNIVNTVNIGASVIVAGFLFVASGGSVLIPAILTTTTAVASLTFIAPRIAASTEKRLNLESSKFISSLKNIKNVFLRLGGEIEKNTKTTANSETDIFTKPRHGIIESIFSESATPNYIANRVSAAMSANVDPSPSR